MKQIFAAFLATLLASVPAFAQDEQLVCQTISEDGSDNGVFTFGPKWAVHRYDGALSGKPEQVDYGVCWPFGPPICWDYSEAPRFRVLSLDGDTVVNVFGNIDSAYPPIVLIYAVECEPKMSRRRGPKGSTEGLVLENNPVKISPHVSNPTGLLRFLFRAPR